MFGTAAKATTRVQWVINASCAQVDALKAKLAAQEVELQMKNDEADKLIRIVEAETAKVSNCRQ